MEQIKPGQMIPFEKALNFRQLGGYQATDGRRVKDGIFYRGGCLDEITSEADKALLDSFGLKTVLDFRSKWEEIDRPDISLPGVNQVRISALRDADDSEVDFSPQNMEEIMKPENLEKAMDAAGEGNVAQFMYGQILFDNPAYQWMFRQIEEGNVPLLFHCSAGKDRTGMAAILILLALGVDKETAIADYELTNQYRTPVIEKFLSRYTELLARRPELMPQLRSIEGVSGEMARLAIENAVAKYGSMEQYFEAEYGLTAPKLADLRNRYLE